MKRAESKTFPPLDGMNDANRKESYIRHGRINGRFTGLHPDVDFETEEHLVDDKILDSFDIVSLIAEINENFDIAVTAKDILPENFNSARALYALIQRLEEEA